MGCAAFLKILHWIFKTCFGVLGALLIAGGVFSCFISSIINSEKVLKEHLSLLPPLATTCFGIALVLIVTIGCCAIRRPNLCCLNAYAAFIIILSLLQMSFGAYCIIAYTDKGYMQSLSRQIRIDLSRAIDSYKTNPETIDNIQRLLECCGNENPREEYNFYLNELPNNSEFPLSCCDSDIVRCGPDTPEVYSEKCFQSVFNYTIASNVVLGWLSLTVGCVELVGGLVSVCLACSWMK